MSPPANLVEFITKNTPANDPKAIIDGYDKFCKDNWMMNLGDDKAKIVIDTIEKYKPKKILEVGTFCGYSSLVMAFHSKGTVHTFDPHKEWPQNAVKIHAHAGLQDKIHFHQGTIQEHEQFIK